MEGTESRRAVRPRSAPQPYAAAEDVLSSPRNARHRSRGTRPLPRLARRPELPEPQAEREESFGAGLGAEPPLPGNRDVAAGGAALLLPRARLPRPDRCQASRTRASSMPSSSAVPNLPRLLTSSSRSRMSRSSRNPRADAADGPRSGPEEANAAGNRSGPASRRRQPAMALSGQAAAQPRATPSGTARRRPSDRGTVVAASSPSFPGNEAGPMAGPESPATSPGASGPRTRAPESSLPHTRGLVGTIPRRRA